MKKYKLTSYETVKEDKDGDFSVTSHQFINEVEITGLAKNKKPTAVIFDKLHEKLDYSELYFDRKEDLTSYISLLP